MDLGWIKLHRKILDSRVFQNEGLLKVWVWCLAKASYSKQWVSVPTGGGGSTEIQIGPGQFIYGRDSAAKELGMKKSTIRNRMEKLKNMQNVDTKKDTHYSVVTIKGWTLYQNQSEAEGQEEGQAEDRRRTGGGHIQERQERKETLSSRPKLRFSEEDMKISLWMFSKIQELQPSRKEPNFGKWSSTIRLMREQDGRTHQEIRDLFSLANADPFWQTNILGPEKLRQKWDDLTLKLQRIPNGKSGTPGTGQGGRRGGPVRSVSPTRPHERDYSDR